MKWILAALVSLLTVITVDASTIIVPTDRATIQNAIESAVEGDSIVVLPGYYQENLNFMGKGVKVVAESGPATTSLFQASPNTTLVRFESNESENALLSGFTISGLSGGPVILISGTASPTISNCVFSGYLGGGNQTVISCETDDALITRNIFYNNKGISCVGIWTGSARIINNTFDHNLRGFFSISYDGYAINNIVTHSTDYGIAGDFALVQYNNVWENGANYEGLGPGTGSISKDPLYVNANQHDYGLSVTSPCIDAGHPDLQYNDPDGSRSDMGALSLNAGNPPLPLFLQVYPHITPGIVYIANPTISWHYWDNSPTTQVAYELEIAVDSSDWSSPVWQSGQVSSAATSVLYNGAPLVIDLPYFVRARLFNGTNWGDWLVTNFRIHLGGTISVPEDFATIQEAIDASLPGDTVWVGPGNYSVQLNFRGKRVIVVSRMGARQTYLYPAVTDQPIATFDHGEERYTFLKGFTIDRASGLSAIRIVGASPTISGNVFSNFTATTDNSVVIATSSGNPLVSRNLFYNNSGISCIGVFDGDASIINNTFDRNSRGFFSLSRGTALNNIVCRSSGYGIAGTFDRQEYNLVWGNHPNYSSSANWGLGNMDTDPLWNNAEAADYQLSLLSPCIDAGDPSYIYNDGDGSRNDMGAYPLDLDSLPRPSNVMLSPVSSDGRVQSAAPTIAWTFFDTSAAAQQAYEIEVGSDNDWTSAEIWNSGQIFTSAQLVPFGGSPLEDGATYWIRLRLSNGTIWGGWVAFPFSTRFVRTLHVPEDFTSIDAAVDEAVTGDSIIVAPGIYYEYFDFLGKALTLVSAEGPYATILRPAPGHGSVTDIHYRETPGTIISGFTFEGGSNLGMIRISNYSSPTIRNNIFFGCTGDVVIRCEQSEPRITHNLFYSNGGISCVGVYSGGARIYNNTFDDNNRGFFSLTTQTIAENNIVTKSREYGIAGSFNKLTYNLTFNNNPNYASGASAGMGSLSLDPRFIDPTVRDYHLQATSPCIDAGDPSVDFNDQDGSRADLGAYPLVFPTTVHVHGISFPGQEMNHITVPTPLIAWGYRSPQGLPQATYHLEVGSDASWDIAEMWTSAPLQDSDTTVLYDGEPLLRGIQYHSRIRVNDGTDWSDWTYFKFRLNTLPTQPETISPRNVVLATSNLVFIASPDVELDGDIQVLDFRLCTDPNLAVEVAHQNGVVVSSGRATWNLVISLEENRQYFWGVRAFDGYEFSPMSPVETFWIDKVPEKPGPFTHLYPATLSEEAVNSVRPTLLWQAAIDPDPADTITYEVEMATDSLFLFHFTEGGIRDTFYTPTAALHVNLQYWWQVKARDRHGNVEYSGISSFWTWMQGDLDLSRRIDLTDLSMLINHLIVHEVGLPNENIGDLDGNCRIDLSDLSRLAFYMTGQQVAFDKPCIDAGPLMVFTRSYRPEPEKKKIVTPHIANPAKASGGAL